MPDGRSRRLPVLLLLLSALAGSAVGAFAGFSFGPGPTHEPPEWVVRQIEDLTTENLSLRRELGVLRLELDESLAEIRNANGPAAREETP